MTHRLAVLTLALVAGPTLAAPPDGAAVYAAKCARCHGKDGQGTKKFSRPLAGDKSLAQLTKLITDTMPEEDPGSLPADEYAAVSKFVHDGFYSPVARERNRPARVELARLTVRQYRHSVADLVQTFRWTPQWGDQRGLKAEYFKNRRFRTQDRVLERMDEQVDFDFGTDTPAPGKTEPHEFSIVWTGSLLAPDTGEYEFTVRTEHAAKLWVNEVNRPLIDAWVKSGSDTEYRGTVPLVGGRQYYLRLEYSKAKQGVNDANKQKTPPPSAKSSVHLLWKRPHREPEPVPARALSPNPAPEQFVSTVRFPPDDRSYGWERGTTVSKEWDQATTDAAIKAAGYIAAKADEWAGGKAATAKLGDGNPASINFDGPKEKPDDQRTKKLKEFARRFAERAFRRPLTAEQVAVIEKCFTNRDPELALKRAVILVLKSPRFLYREVGGGPDGYDVAARLSFGLWDSIPDQHLLTEAAAGRLKTKEQVAKQAERMLADPRAKAKLKEFLLAWTRANEEHDLAKDPKRFPGFDAAAISDLRTSLELAFDDALASDTAAFGQLLLSDEVFLNARLAKFYGATVPGDGRFHKVKLDPGQRAGVLTHPFLMTNFAYTAESSPIHRGVFLARGLLGLALRPPPEAVSPTPADLHPGLTTRQRVDMQTRPAACMTCHGVINPLGFTLENFDAVGRFRKQEADKLVDPTGGYQTRDGQTVKLQGARELAQFLADSPEAHEAFAEQLFHHMAQQPVRAYGPTAEADLVKAFAANKFQIRKLAVDIATTAALKPRS